MTIPYLQKEVLESNRALVGQIEAMAKAKECSVAQLCLAWVMKKGGIPIPGTTKASRAAKNCAATAVVDKLTLDECAELEAVAAAVVGLRGDENYMKSTFHSQSAPAADDADAKVAE